MLTVEEVKLILRRLNGIIRSATMINGLGSIEFDGGIALNDLLISSTGYTGLLPKQYIIRVSATGTPDSFRYSTDGGATWAVAASMLTSPISLSDGISVKWLATTGHTLGTTWTFVTTPNFATNRLRDVVQSVGDIDVLNSLVSSVHGAGRSINLAQYKADIKAMLSALINAVEYSTLGYYLEDNSLYSNCDMVNALCATIPAAYVIPPQTTLGLGVFTAEDAKTYTVKSTIDPTKYNGGKIELYALTAITDTGTDGVTSIQGIDAAGDEVAETVAVPFGGSLLQYETLDLSAAYPQRFRSVTGIGITGGAAGQRFIIQTKEDWLPVL